MLNFKRLVITTAVLAVVSVTESANAQDLTAEHLLRQQQGKTELDPRLIIVNRRQPVPFIPFEMIDVVTNAPIPPDSILTFDTTEVRAGDYFPKLNEIEKGLNEMGYSLRDDWTSIVIQRSAINTSELESQARRIRTATNPATAFGRRTFTEFTREVLVAPEAPTEVEVMRQPTNIPAVPRVGVIRLPPTTSTGTSRGVEQAAANMPAKKIVVTSTNEYPFEIGDPSLFAASVNGRLDLTGSEENLRLSGAARAGVSIFGVTSDLARLDGFMNSPKKGNMTGKVTLDVLPFGTIYNLSLNGASVTKEDNISRGVEVQFANFRVMIGPVPVQVKAGAQGSVGVRYSASLNPASAIAEFAPIVRSSLYVQAGIDIVVAGAGAGASMTLVNYDLAMHGALRLMTQVPTGKTKPELGIRQQYYLSHKLAMLSGNAYAYAYIYVPRCCIPPWTKKEWRWQIFEWDGFTPVDGTLVDVTSFTSLGIPATR